MLERQRGMLPPRGPYIPLKDFYLLKKACATSYESTVVSGGDLTNLERYSHSAIGITNGI